MYSKTSRKIVGSASGWASALPVNAPSRQACRPMSVKFAYVAYVNVDITTAIFERAVPFGGRTVNGR